MLKHKQRKMQFKELILVTFCFMTEILSSYGRYLGPNPCKIVVRKPYYMFDQYKEANPKCTEGVIDWMYPSGTVTVSFTYHVPFLLCLPMKPDPAKIKFIDVTEIPTQQLPNTGDGNLACVPDLNGRVKIKFVGPGFMKTYLSIFKYYIVTDWTP